MTEGIPSSISSGKKKIDLFLGEKLGMFMDRDFYRVQGMAAETTKCNTVARVHSSITRERNELVLPSQR